MGLIGISVIVGLAIPNTIHSDLCKANECVVNPLDVLAENPTTENIKRAIVYLADKYGADSKCFDAIVRYESHYKNVCNFEYGCGAGKGYVQLIESTTNHCSKKLGRIIDPNNAVDNLECGAWLLANEGTRHWGCPDCEWGSYWKWKDYCKNNGLAIKYN